MRILACGIRGKIERIRAWFLVWYSLEAMIIFSIALWRIVSPESDINAPINALFFACAGSLEWPGVVLLSLITGVFVTPTFMLINGLILISSITSIIIEYKYDICSPIVFGLSRRINAKVIREIFAGIFVWYIFEAILIFWLVMLNNLMSIYKTTDLIEVIFLGGILSVFWPMITFIFFIMVDASSNPFFLGLCGSALIFLIISLIVEYKFHFAYSKILNIQ